MNKKGKTRRAVYFDLTDSELKKFFGEKNTLTAYRKIRRFMEKNGFEHRQYSGYISLKPMSRYRVQQLIQQLGKEESWLFSCTQKLDVMEIQEEYDYLSFLQKYKIEQENKSKQEQQAQDEEWEEEEDEWEEER